MRTLAAALLLCCAAPAAATPMFVFENELDYLVREAVMANPQGVELAALLKGRGRLPGLCLEEGPAAGGRGLGAYYAGGKICFNIARVMRFYNNEGERPEDQDWASRSRQMGTMRELARELAPDYYHELVHCWQYQLLRGAALPAVESEREAYLRSALFFNELAKAEPVLLARQAAQLTYGKKDQSPRDPSEAASDYFALCAGRKAYFGGIDALYAGRGERLAAGDPAGARYAAGINKFADRVWPALWKDAALNAGRAALTAGSYPRALRCLLPDPAEVVSYGLPKADETIVYAEGERALAFALMKLRSLRGEDGDFDEYAGLFRAVEEAHARVNRRLPSDLAEKRPAVYAEARKFYAGALAAEKDKGWRAYLRSALQYFSR